MIFFVRTYPPLHKVTQDSHYVAQLNATPSFTKNRRQNRRPARRVAQCSRGLRTWEPWRRNKAGPLTCGLISEAGWNEIFFQFRKNVSAGAASFLMKLGEMPVTTTNDGVSCRGLYLDRTAGARKHFCTERSH